MKTPGRLQGGFALISSLAILSILVILIVAYAVTMRTERAASQNFLERERAQAIGQAVLSHIMADHATPKIDNGRLKPFAVDPTTKLPTAETERVYNDPTPEAGIYTINPMPGLSTRNHLVRVSHPSVTVNSPGGGTSAQSFDYTRNPAYNPIDWAWARQKAGSAGADNQTDAQFFQPQTSDGTPIAPQWVPYYEVKPGEEGGSVSGEPVGEVAFAIWDESGKVDVNLAGPDNSINGVAPHDLKLEDFVIQSDRNGGDKEAKKKEFMAHLNGGASDVRDRNNFSLRRISEKPTEHGRGNDRWFFSVEEMLERGFFSSDKVLDVTHSSRDFDVRPEWDGDRAPASAEKFLRSYINNPKLFELFTHSRAGAHLVMADMRENILRQKLLQNGLQPTEDGLQVMRLLAALRLSLPPYRPYNLQIVPPGCPPITAETPVPGNLWNDYDVWGIALNIMQASAPASDQNLFAFDRGAYGVSPFLDPNVRIGIRVSPYITETAIRVTRQNANQVKLEQFFEIWNPYPFELYKPGTKTPIRYYYGNWTGGQWETSHTDPTGGIYDMNRRWELGTPANPNPGPGKFVVKRLERIVTWPASPAKDFMIRTRPYIQNADYWETPRTGTSGGVEESSSYSISIGPFFSKGGSDPKYNVIHVIPASLINRKVSPTSSQYIPAWHSFQIDDPRMGPFSRYNKDYKDTSIPLPKGWEYTWQGYLNEHSLFGIAKDPLIPEAEKNTSQYGDGYNRNFGANWPQGMTFSGAMATFALPQRPFLNVGELGTVFANRPWKTLSFAQTTAPLDKTVVAGTKPQNFPTALLDYLTTVGTTTDRRDLPYRSPGAVPPPTLRWPGGFILPNVTARTQKTLWLFEDVQKGPTGEKDKATGNLRPIRGRINLNSASRDTIRHLLSAPYRVVRSLGLPSNAKSVNPTDPESDVVVEILEDDADMVAAEIVGDTANKVNSIRPIRSMADLGKLTSIPKLHAKYPDAVVDAMVGRLAQFGTVRQQIYTVDVIARAFSPLNDRNRNQPRVVTGEVRFMARVYFDTFSRRGFVESIEYR